jgi:hypothetical protein
MDKSGAGAGFLQELRFPLPIYIPSASPQSSSLSPEVGTIGQEWPQCQEFHKQENKKTKKKKDVGGMMNRLHICKQSRVSAVFTSLGVREQKCIILR